MLARAQSQLVAAELEKLHPGLRVELILIKTSGDAITDKPLHEFGGKGLFTKELEQALLAGDVDLAVHSMKDLPVTMPLVDPSRLVVAAVPKRQDPRDVLVSRGNARTLLYLAQGARVGTGSLRRRAQLLSLRPDLDVQAIRGNIDTRLKKQLAGEFDALVLAAAGLRRSGLFDSTYATPIDPSELLPAAGQGALALQCRGDDSPTRRLLEALNDETAAACVRIERRVVWALNGDCHSPIAAFATIEAGALTLRAAVGGRDGQPPLIRAESQGPIAQAEATLDAVVESLRSQGAIEMLGTARA
jgi:hydroxymethylbilane synthase